MLEDLTNTVRPGDRVRIGGIIDVEERRVRGGATEYRLRVTGHSQVVEGGADGPTEITQDDITWARRMAATDTVYDNLVASFAPKIRRATPASRRRPCCCLASSWESDRSRGDINVLIVGDPGQGKSEILKFAASVAPRGIYTAGRSSTAAGLTAAVIKDKNGGMSLEAGACVLGDRGLVCIDEFDKLSKEDRSSLHECMEQQSISLAKGGIVTTLNARTSILAAANPDVRQVQHLQGRHGEREPPHTVAVQGST